MEHVEHLPFTDRTDAGKRLATVLRSYIGSNGYVLALLRGGVVIGREIAAELKLPLFPFVVRKIGHPQHEEYALGAIAEGSGTYLDERLLAEYGLQWSDIEPVIEREQRELDRRKQLFHPDPLPSLAGKTIIIADDGAATGATMIAAIDSIRKMNPERVIAAIPVCPPDTGALLRRHADDLAVLAEPEPFLAVAQWYRSFEQLNDEEVLDMLHKKTAA